MAALNGLGGRNHRNTQLWELNDGPAKLEWQIVPEVPEFLRIVNSKEGGPEAIAIVNRPGTLIDDKFELLRRLDY